MLPQYDRIPRADDAQTYLDIALARGRDAAARVKGIAEYDMLIKAKEKDRIRTIRDSLIKSLEHIHDAYPSFEGMSEFTRHIFALEMDPDRAKIALGALHRGILTIKALSIEHLKRLLRAKGADQCKKIVGAYLGRIGSVLEGLEEHLLVINEARTVFRKIPIVDDSLFSVAIAGFPNVGKSTLLGKLTSANPEIQPYAFTTKGLNVGYFEHLYNRIQCIDTPGTLNREQMNDIERKAEVAITYLANLIVYVFDPTLGYPLEDQEALYKELKKLHKPLVVYVSKTDIASEEQLAAIERIAPAIREIATLKEAIIKGFKEWL